MPEYKKVIDKNNNEMFYEDGRLMKKSAITDEIRSRAEESAKAQDGEDQTHNHENGIASDVAGAPPVDPAGANGEENEENESEEEPAPGGRRGQEAQIEAPELPVTYGAPPMSTPGMGFKMNKNGQTLSVFGKEVSQTVKHIAGQMVPLTHEEYSTKTDQEILEQLKKLGKV